METEPCACLAAGAVSPRLFVCWSDHLVTRTPALPWYRFDEGLFRKEGGIGLGPLGFPTAISSLQSGPDANILTPQSGVRFTS